MLTRHPILTVIAGLLVPLVASSPAFSMRAPASTESPTALDVEKRLKAGAEEITLFIEPAIHKGRIVGQPEPYQPSRNVSPSDPDIWRDMNLRQAAWVVLKDVEAVEGTGKDNQGKAVIRLPSLGSKPIVTAAPWAKTYNQKLTVRVRPDSDGGLPQVLAVYNQANEIVDGIRVYVDIKIPGGGPKKDEPYAFLADEIGPDFWGDPRIDNEAVKQVFLRGIAAHSSRGWSVLRLGEGTEVITKGRYSTPSNRTLGVEITRDPQSPKEWIVAKVFNGARENISPDFSRSDIRVYLEKAPESGQVPAGSRVVMTTSLLGPTFWGNFEVMSAQEVLLDGVPVLDINGVAGVKVGQRQIILTDLPFNPDLETRLLVYAHPTDRQAVPFVESAFHQGRRVYPAKQVLVSVNPVIVQGRITEAEHQFWLDSDKVDAGQFWNLAEIKDAERVAWSGGSIEDSSGYASVRVGDTRYSSDVLFLSLEGDQLLVVARPATRELVSAFRLLNAERVPFRKAAGLEEAAGVLAAAISDLKSELSQIAVPGRTVRMEGNPRALIVTSDGLFKLSAAPIFRIPGEEQFRIEALASDEPHRKQVRGVLGSLGFTNYRVYNAQDFGGEAQAVSALQSRLSSERFDTLLVTAASGLEEVGRFLGTPIGESSVQALEGSVARYRSLWS